jgi:hypothetical protein
MLSLDSLPPLTKIGVGKGGANTLLSREVDFYDEAMRLERRQSLKVLEACLRGYH